MMNRRRFFLGAAALLTAPAVAKTLAMLPPAPKTFEAAYTDALRASWPQTKEVVVARVLNEVFWSGSCLTRFTHERSVEIISGWRT